MIDQKGTVFNMDVQIQSSNINLTEALCDRIERHIASALDSYSDCINEAVVYIEATSELGETLGLVCRINLDLKPFGWLTAQAIDENVDLAIRRAAHQIGCRLKANQDLMQPDATRLAIRS